MIFKSYLHVHEQVVRHGRHSQVCYTVPQHLYVWNVSGDLIHIDIACLFKKHIAVSHMRNGSYKMITE